VKRKLGFAGLVVLLLIVCGSRGFALSPYVAVDGRIGLANRSPAGLMGLESPEFGLKLRIVSQDQGTHSREYRMIYAEPDYGTGAGSLHFIYSDAYRRATYAVADQAVDSVNVGLALNYINIPIGEDQKEQYVSADLGLQLGNLWLVRFGVLVENLVYVKLDKEYADLSRNVIAGAAVQLGDFGIAALDVDDLLNKNAKRRLIFGLEVKPVRLLALRAGWDEGWSLGAEFSCNQISFGYDWAQGQHQLSLNWKF
jgi:hypothetical protein